ncbi:MAG: fumarylacetoacetate hydrolase family protein [Nocardioides sp.]
MRIARFTSGDEPVFGVVHGELDRFGQPSEDSVVIELRGDPLYAGIEPTGAEHRLADVRLLAPVIPRSKIVAIGKNYAAHAAEFDGVVPAEPLMFLKPNTSVIGPGDAIAYPRQSAHVDFEGELAVVIGRICRDVPPEQATDVIFGYTIANDVTARDLQRGDGQWSRAKGFDTFCPLGPWIETDLDPHNFTAEGGGRAVQTHLNGDLKQDGNTRDLVFDIPTLIAHITAVMTLLPGDVILTGTPEGVGPMAVGDEVEVSIEGLGALTNRVVARD